MPYKPTPKVPDTGPISSSSSSPEEGGHLPFFPDEIAQKTTTLETPNFATENSTQVDSELVQNLSPDNSEDIRMISNEITIDTYTDNPVSPSSPSATTTTNPSPNLSFAQAAAIDQFTLSYKLKSTTTSTLTKLATSTINKELFSTIKSHPLIKNNNNPIDFFNGPISTDKKSQIFYYSFSDSYTDEQIHLASAIISTFTTLTQDIVIIAKPKEVYDNAYVLKTTVPAAVLEERIPHLIESLFGNYGSILYTYLPKKKASKVSEEGLREHDYQDEMEIYSIVNFRSFILPPKSALYTLSEIPPGRPAPNWTNLYLSLFPEKCQDIISRINERLSSRPPAAAAADSMDISAANVSPADDGTTASHEVFLTNETNNIDSPADSVTQQVTSNHFPSPPSTPISDRNKPETLVHADTDMMDSTADNFYPISKRSANENDSDDDPSLMSPKKTRNIRKLKLVSLPPSARTRSSKNI
ncbi:hypothetical protein C6P40_001989, partial [Pichia californica]